MLPPSYTASHFAISPTNLAFEVGSIEWDGAEAVKHTSYLYHTIRPRLAVTSQLVPPHPWCHFHNCCITGLVTYS